MIKALPVLLASLIATAALPAKNRSISELQGASHQSPFAGKEVTTSGVVTYADDKGYYLQSRTPDNDPNTSEAIYVFNHGQNPSVGSLVTITGTLTEYPKLKEGDFNLQLTEISRVRLKGVAANMELPEPVSIDSAEHPIPDVIKVPGSDFDAGKNALDYWESLEGMRVTIDTPYVVGGTSKYGEFTVLAHANEEGLLRTPRGGLILPESDVSTQRIQVKFGHDKTDLNVGDVLAGPLTGVVTYSYGNYKVQLTEPFPGVAKTAPAPETPQLNIPEGSLKIATFNVENLDPGDSDHKFARLADIITHQLHSPDILGLQEIQDNNGPKDDGTVDADQTLDKLIKAISSAGGPTYNYAQLNPVNNADGGQPGANIRNVFLFNPDSVSLSQLLHYEHPAFIASDKLDFSPTRKPLVAVFKHGQESIAVINCHLKSKGGDSPAFGAQQPAIKYTETQRSAQAVAVGSLCANMIAKVPDMKVIVLGDMNDFEFSNPLKLMQEKGGLVDLVNHVPANQRYSYCYQGHNQELDHILINAAAEDLAQIHIAHVNSDFAASAQVSDHDPVLVWFPYTSR